MDEFDTTTTVIFSVWWQGKDRHKLKVLTIILTRRKHKVINEESTVQNL